MGNIRSEATFENNVVQQVVVRNQGLEGIVPACNASVGWSGSWKKEKPTQPTRVALARPSLWLSLQPSLGPLVSSAWGPAYCQLASILPLPSPPLAAWLRRSGDGRGEQGP